MKVLDIITKIYGTQNVRNKKFSNHKNENKNKKDVNYRKITKSKKCILTKCSLIRRIFTKDESELYSSHVIRILIYSLSLLKSKALLVRLVTAYAKSNTVKALNV